MHLHAVVLTVLCQDSLALQQVKAASSESPHGDGVLAKDFAHRLDNWVLKGQSKVKF